MDLVDLVPAQRRRYLRAGPGADGPGAEHGLVRRVLVEVDEDTLAAFLLPPGRGDQVWPPALQLAGYRHRRAADLVGVPARLKPDVDVDAPVPRGLGVAGHARLGQQRPQLGGGLLDMAEGHAWSRVEVDAQLVGVIRVAGQVRPHMEAEAAESHGPQDVINVGRDQRLRSRAIRRGDDGRLEPGGLVL